MINKSFSENIYDLSEFRRFVESESKINDKTRYELIDGYIFIMESPSVKHQRLSKFIYNAFDSYFRRNGGKTPCEVFYAPLDVYLFEAKNGLNNCLNAYQPDVFVVCDKNKIKERGIEGAPDLVVEIAGKSSYKTDFILKYNNYMRCGVKEYWIVNERTEQLIIYFNGGDDMAVKEYRFDDVVKSRLFEGLYIDFASFDNE